MGAILSPAVTPRPELHMRSHSTDKDNLIALGVTYLRPRVFHKKRYGAAEAVFRLIIN